MSTELHAVTGAFGFTGKHIARLLLERGHHVRTLTGHLNRENPFGSGIEVARLAFDDVDELCDSLNGVRVLYNTYWIRFAHGKLTFDVAVENSRKLINAAAAAGVERIVHTSITNPSADSPLPYFRGKALVEEHIVHSGLSYSILRPAVIYGDKGILINNMAWMLRHLPALGAAGDGRYRLSPIFVEDFAALAVDAGAGTENTVTDALGPETFTYDELVRAIASAIGVRKPLVHLPDWMVLLAGWGLGLVMRDVVLTRDEVAGLTAGLLATDAPPLGTMKLTAWLADNRDTIGRRYASELKKHYSRFNAD